MIFDIEASTGGDFVESRNGDRGEFIPNNLAIQPRRSSSVFSWHSIWYGCVGREYYSFEDFITLFYPYPTPQVTPQKIGFEASGYVGDISWSIESGSLPSGLSLITAGEPAGKVWVSGTPTTREDSSFTIKITDSSTGYTKSETYEIKIKEEVTIDDLESFDDAYRAYQEGVGYNYSSASLLGTMVPCRSDQNGSGFLGQNGCIAEGAMYTNATRVGNAANWGRMHISGQSGSRNQFYLYLYGLYDPTDGWTGNYMIWEKTDDSEELEGVYEWIRPYEAQYSGLPTGLPDSVTIIAA